MSIRVVAGSVRGRRLEVPPGNVTRPTSDRVREAMFNSLASLGAVDGAVVLDLFAGSGALAIEALSRGAASATLVESDRNVRPVLARNVAATGFDDVATVVASDALAHLARSSQHYGLALLDPPYRYEGWPELLAALVPRLAAGAVVVLESDEPVGLIEPLTLVREKRYGGTVVQFSQMPLDAPASQLGDRE